MEPNKYNNPRPPYPPPPPPEEPQNRYSGQSPYGAPYQDPRFRQPPYQGMDPRYGYGMPPQGRQWQEPLPQREQTNGMGIADTAEIPIFRLFCTLHLYREQARQRAL